jgi:hypothetical protein
LEPIRITVSPSSKPSSGTVVSRPLFAPVLVSITTGRPDSTAAHVVRPPLARYTTRSAWCSVRAKSHDPGRVAANRRIERCSRLASA